MSTPPIPPPPPPTTDPMFSTLAVKPASQRVRSDNRPRLGWVLPVVMAICLAGLLAYTVYLHYQLGVSQGLIVQANDDIDAADTRIGQLEEKLYATENALVNEIRSTGQKLTTLTTQQSQEVERIRRDVTQKADRTQVEDVSRRAEHLVTDVGGLRDNIQHVDQSVRGVDQKVDDLNTRVEDQARTIEEQQRMLADSIHNINANKDLIDSTRSNLMNLRTSLERDYYIFQVHTKSGIIRVQDVGVRLKKARTKDLNFDLEIFYDDKKVEKKKVPVSEPIFFYKMGYQKPYEIMISEAGNNRVAGYLSVPKTRE